MPKVLAIAEVEDGAKWEEGFRTHTELFRSQSVSKPIHFAVDGNQVAICFEPDDVDTFFKVADSPATAEAMAHDGVKRETVKFYTVDKELNV